jgi:ribosomal protein L37AE/L43A
MGWMSKIGEDGSQSVYQCNKCGRKQTGGAKGTCGASIPKTGYTPVTKYKWEDE